MSPEVDQMLRVSAAQLAGSVVPFLSASYAQGHASLLSLLMVMSAQEYERGADIRWHENADMRLVFRELAPDVTDAALRASLETAADTHDESLTISSLNKTNAELRRLLILLQTHVEDTENRNAQDRIWDVLKRSAAHRLVRLA